jgi:hypothetical protein
MRESLAQAVQSATRDMSGVVPEAARFFRTVSNHFRRMSATLRTEVQAAIQSCKRSAKISKAIEDHAAGLGCIEAFRKECETSLTATVIRYSALTRASPSC